MGLFILLCFALLCGLLEAGVIRWFCFNLTLLSYHVLSRSVKYMVDWLVGWLVGFNFTDSEGRESALRSDLAFLPFLFLVFFFFLLRFRLIVKMMGNLVIDHSYWV